MNPINELCSNGPSNTPKQTLFQNETNFQASPFEVFL